jgi:hypothetical protein
MSFSSDLNRFSTTMGYRMDYVVQHTVLDIAENIIDRSPVGDPLYWKGKAPPGYVGGTFRGNWQHQEGGRYPTNKFETRGKPPSLERIKASVPERASGKNHWVVNNMPYSIRLEYGYSRQARGQHAIVGVAVMQFRQIVRAQTALARRQR